MERKPYSDYTLSGTILLGASGILLVIATITNRADITSASLFLCGVACFLGAIFILTFSREDPPDTALLSLLPVSGSINVARICADLGLAGNAWFIPPEQPGGAVREFIPVFERIPRTISGDFSFQTSEDEPGMLVVPAAMPLLATLELKSLLRQPSGDAEAVVAIKELCEDVLEVADKIDATWEGSRLVFSVRGYKLLEGCRYIQRESPKCCTTHPCGICSLAGCLLALGTGQPWQVERIELRDREGILIIQCTNKA